MNITRRDFCKYALLTGTAASCTTFFGKGIAFAKKDSLVYGCYPKPEDFVNTQKDWWAKYNFELKLDWYSHGGDTGNALIAGKIDLDSPGAGRLVSLNSKLPGQFTQLMVSTYGDYSATLVKPDSPYKTMADLKGKKIGCAIGSGAHMTWLVYLDENGFKPEDFKIVNLKGEDHVASLSAGAVDGITTWEPYPSIAEYRGIGRVVALFGEHVSDMAVLQGITEDIKKNRESYVKAVAGFLDAQEFIHNNPSKAAKTVSEGLKKRGVDTPWQAFEQIFKERLIYKPDFALVKSSLDKLGKLAIKLKRIKKMPVFTWGDDILAAAQKLRKSA